MIDPDADASMAPSPPRWERREVLRAGMLVAATIGLPVVALRALARASGQATDRQLALARETAQMLIPRTDTPGGGDAGADAFLVLALAHGLAGTRTPPQGPLPEDARLSPDGTIDYLGWLEHALDQGCDGDFLKAPLARRRQALDAVDGAAFARPRSGSPWLKIKELLLTGYYTSEAGGAQELRYELVPGRFDPDLPLRPADRAWSSDWTSVEFG